MELDIPFVIVESAPRKRGKTTFNLELLPRTEKRFDFIYIFCPSIKYKDEYYVQFHTNPKYHLYSENLHAELEKVISQQKARVERAAKDRRRQAEEEKKQSQSVSFVPARVNSRKRRLKKGQFNIVKGNVIYPDYPAKLKGYEMLVPDIFAGTPGPVQKSQLGKAKVIDVAGPQILIVLDDCIGEGLFDGQGPAQELAARGRHFNTSLIASTQQLTRVDIIIRNNADYWFFWCPHSVQELESFIEKFVSQNFRRVIRDIVMRSYQGPHDFIFYDPNALDWTERFTVGDMKNFFNKTMRKVFNNELKTYFYPVVTT